MGTSAFIIHAPRRSRGILDQVFPVGEEVMVQRGHEHRTLSVDPEDLEAHYNLMLCYRGLNDETRAAREERYYQRFKADEASRAITGPYALAHPEDNNEAQPIHEHASVALEETGSGTGYANRGGESLGRPSGPERASPQRAARLRGRASD